MLDRFVEAWKRNDSKEIARLWAPDGELITLTGERLVGQAEVEKTYSSAFNELLATVPFEPRQGYRTGLMKHPAIGPDLSHRVLSIRFTKSETARVDGTWAVLAGDLGPDGRFFPLNAKYTGGAYRAEVTNRNGEWLIRELQFMGAAEPAREERK